MRHPPEAGNPHLEIRITRRRDCGARHPVTSAPNRKTTRKRHGQKTQKGLEIRKAVLGEAYVNNALKNADGFNKPFQELVTEYCWGAVWGREELPHKTRSMLNLAMISILEPAARIEGAHQGRADQRRQPDEIREIFMQVAIYAGVPAGVDSFRIAREVFAELDKG